MLAKAAAVIPEGDGWLYEPKWDGFRCIVFRDGDDVELGSRNERPLTRYFPELIEPLRRPSPNAAWSTARSWSVDSGGPGLDFDALQQRIHPAESRVNSSRPRRRPPSSPSTCSPSATTGGRAALERRELEGGALAPAPPVHLTPAPPTGRGPRLVRPLRGRRPRRRDGQAPGGAVPARQARMIKVKHHRTADCVVAGFRWHKPGRYRLAAARPLRRRGRPPPPGRRRRLLGRSRKRAPRGARPATVDDATKVTRGAGGPSRAHEQGRVPVARAAGTPPGPVVRAAAPRAGVRGRTYSCRRSLPPRGPFRRWRPDRTPICVATTSSTSPSRSPSPTCSKPRRPRKWNVVIATRNDRSICERSYDGDVDFNLPWRR